MRVIDWSRADADERRDALARPPARMSDALIGAVRRIFDEVARDGIDAVARFTKAFDGVEMREFCIEIETAPERLPEADRRAIDHARANIERFHRAQRREAVDVEVEPGVRCALVQRPLRAVGLYAPAGGAPLFSTALMLATPARIAGVGEIALTTPPGADGRPHAALIEAARACGLQRIYVAGGAQAIAALALGVAPFPKADKIFGPGNAYVAAAKAHAASLPGGPAIDLPAGPSEVMVIADDAADPRLVAADLLSQAEHDADAQALLVALSARLVEAVLRELDRQLASLPRRDVAAAALRASRAILAPDLACALEIADAYAPEHLILSVEEPEALVDDVAAAGAVFVGRWTSETAGDYAAGANHVLPTDGAARAWSGVSLDAFMRTMTVQRMTTDGARALGPDLARLARLEGLEAHARAAEMRVEMAARRGAAPEGAR